MTCPVQRAVAWTVRKSHEIDSPDYFPCNNHPNWEVRDGEVENGFSLEAASFGFAARAVSVTTSAVRKTDKEEEVLKDQRLGGQFLGVW